MKSKETIAFTEAWNYSVRAQLAYDERRRAFIREKVASSNQEIKEIFEILYDQAEFTRKNVVHVWNVLGQPLDHSKVAEAQTKAIIAADNIAQLEEELCYDGFYA